MMCTFQLKVSMNQDQVQDRLSVMRAQEDSTYWCSDYFRDLQQVESNSDDSGPIDHVCRSKMTQWCYSVIDFIQFRRETVGIAMSYLDRFLCTDAPRARQVRNCRKLYQLASMTALFMAIKINEPVVIDLNILTDLSKGLYTFADFTKMENDILFALNWHVNGPTPQEFMVHILTLVQQQETKADTSYSLNIDFKNILEQATYQIEVAIGEHDLMTQKPSNVATASIWNCIEHQGLISSLNQVASSLGIILEDISSTRERLIELKQRSKMETRTSMRSIPETQSKSSKTVTSSMQCTTDDSKHCSPICVSKRSLTG